MFGGWPIWGHSCFFGCFHPSHGGMQVVRSNGVVALEHSHGFMPGDRHRGDRVDA
jgi:hypothetical protein